MWLRCRAGDLACFRCRPRVPCSRRAPRRAVDGCRVRAGRRGVRPGGVGPHGCASPLSSSTQGCQAGPSTLRPGLRRASRAGPRRGRPCPRWLRAAPAGGPPGAAPSRHHLLRCRRLTTTPRRRCRASTRTAASMCWAARRHPQGRCLAAVPCPPASRPPRRRGPAARAAQLRAATAATRRGTCRSCRPRRCLSRSKLGT